MPDGRDDGQSPAPPATGGGAFHGAPSGQGHDDRRFALLAAVLVLGFIGVAIAKPWDSPARTTTPTPPASQVAAVTSGVAPGSPAPPADAGTVAAPVPGTFDTASPPVSASWTGLRWRRLEPEDPLVLVDAAVAWRDGFIALGSAASSTASGQPGWASLWTSADGAHWELLPAETATTLWPGLIVVGAAATGGSIVLVTEPIIVDGCDPEPICPPGVMAWTTPDGRTWEAGDGSALGALSDVDGRRFLAAGSGGLVVVSGGSPADVALSADGLTWAARPAGTMPLALAVGALIGTATGYVAGGALTTGPDAGKAATSRSSDGRTWTKPQPLPGASGPGDPSAVERLVTGADGLLAVGPSGSVPGLTAWWQSSDGMHWAQLDAMSPPGSTACSAWPCTGRPDGVLAGNGRRMVAVRGGADGGAWISADGAHWRPMRMEGDAPTAPGTRATLLPGGVLLSDGTTSWFGEAIAE